MKLTKLMLGVLAAMALLAFIGPGTASAGGVLCDAEETPCKKPWAANQILDFTLESGTSAKLTDTEGTVFNTCTAGTFEVELNENPDAKGEATGRNVAILWGNVAFPCTFATNTIEVGAFKIANIAGTANGTVRADKEIQITMNTVLFGKCIYGIAAGDHLGELKEGKYDPENPEVIPPTLAINTVLAKKAGDSCAIGPNSLKLTASYTMTRPEKTTLWVAKE